VKAGTGGSDIWTVAPGGKPAPFVATEAAETAPAFSPDGRLLAYVSDASGRGEVYVRPYPGAGAAIPVSGDGGGAPGWSPDGRRIYYIQARNTKPVMMAADVLSRAPLRVARARPFIDPWPYGTAAGSRNYDVMPDGSFIVSELRGSSGSGGTRPDIRRLLRVGEVHVIVNFAAMLTTGSAR
jgi:serine/threonine-protein kinase